MSDYLNPDVQSLIDKVYNEGIERANGQAQQIISDAQQAASGLMEEAKRRIQAMEAEALKEMEHKRNSLDSELKTAAKQVLSNIKNELGETLSTKIVTQGLGEAISDGEFLQKMISIVLQRWDPADARLDLDLLVSPEEGRQLRGFFEQRIKKEWTGEIEIIVDKKINSGFKINMKKEHYYVSFCDEDFEAFFKSYLRKKTVDWIYGIKQDDHED
ncbi:MAG TPA: hypothetical protein VHE34_16565 [Puia sp.]|uniref:hypothetical protein n=1 Tax=Puia sp. TaxID=2045100 RepID=UPI0009284FC8|nr:hypothetical protein [Puia sp.]MBN8852721.1 hypothetical protein [Sphingobacteriales bacterium]OJW55542.1 MAG: hypothetical protein BGO55_03090 [Sphingobacteriales bacterium 50-39]HVU96845.1 hypothetical protein [Puia sp.]